MNDLVGLVSNHQQEFTPLIKLFIVMTFMMFLPTIIFMMTSFVRIIITFSFLKSALGAQQSIPNQILVGIALVLTIFIMSPVVDKINKEAIQPYREEKITFQEGIEKAQIPMKEFGQAEQVADLTVFLAGQDYLTGQVVAIDGGLSM